MTPTDPLWQTAAWLLLSVPVSAGITVVVDFVWYVATGRHLVK